MGSSPVHCNQFHCRDLRTSTSTWHKPSYFTYCFKLPNSLQAARIFHTNDYVKGKAKGRKTVSANSHIGWYQMVALFWALFIGKHQPRAFQSHLRNNTWNLEAFGAMVRPLRTLMVSQPQVVARVLTLMVKFGQATRSNKRFSVNFHPKTERKLLPRFQIYHLCHNGLLTTTRLLVLKAIRPRILRRLRPKLFRKT